MISILVDEVGEVLELSSRDFEPLPDSTDSATRRLARGVYKLPQDLLLELDVNAISVVAEPAA